MEPLDRIQINAFALFDLPIELGWVPSVCVADAEFLLTAYAQKHSKKTIELLFDGKDVIDFSRDFYKIAAEFGLSGKMETKVVKNKVYLIFRDYVRAKRSKNITRILEKNELKYFEDLAALGRLGIQKAFKSDVKWEIAITLVNVSLDVADAVLNDKKISVGILTNNLFELNKGILSSALAAGVTTMVVATGGSVLLPITVCFVVGVVLGKALDYIDEEYQIKKNLADAFESNYESPKFFIPDASPSVARKGNKKAISP